MKINKTNKTETKTEGFFPKRPPKFPDFLEILVNFRWEKGPSGPFFGACGAEKGGAPAARPFHFPFWGACGAPFSFIFSFGAPAARHSFPLFLWFWRYFRFGFSSVQVRFCALKNVLDVFLEVRGGGALPNFNHLR